VGNSYEIIYGQLENLKVSEGDTIKEGAVIGTLAEPTDYFTLEGANLYFQILQEDTPVNPLLLLK
jgi:septal ring factor EnvC (AmiA/AmiB activator)